MNLPEKFVLPVTEGVDLRQATALILAWATAYGMLAHSARVTRGQRISVHGLSGAVGTALLHLAQLRGAEVFGEQACGTQCKGSRGVRLQPERMDSRDAASGRRGFRVQSARISELR
jgi:hypothetical protein